MDVVSREQLVEKWVCAQGELARLQYELDTAVARIQKLEKTIVLLKRKRYTK